MSPEESKAEGLSQSISAIRDRFANKHVLVTGATGFVGKVLIEKLLRSCPGIVSIRILMRPCPKRGTLDERIERLYQDRVFDRIRDDKNILFKIRPLHGDITEANMGLSEEQLELLKSEVAFVFHCAANVRFDDNAKKIFSSNLLGVKNVIEVASMCKNLEAFVHVSTAYSFCNHSEIDEKLYPESLPPKYFLDNLWMTDDVYATFVNYYAHGRPSLYHYSKAMAEIFVTTFAQENRLPAIIVRPTIITASVSEPFPGWIDNINGPSGFISVSGRGIVKTLKVADDVNADWVPVDIVANTLIVAAHHTATVGTLDEAQNERYHLYATPSQVPIINCNWPDNNDRKTWSEVIKLCIPLLNSYPFLHSIDAAGGTVTNNRLKYEMARLFRHTLFAVIADCILFICFQKPMFVNIYRRIHRVMDHLEHFTTHRYIFKTTNMDRLVMLNLEAEDFNIGQIPFTWESYLRSYVLGVRRYILKEDDKSLKQALTKQQRLVSVWWIIRLSFVGILLMHLSRKHTKPIFYLPIFSAKPVAEYLKAKFSKYLS